MFVGPVAIAYSPDPVAASKVVADFAKTNEKSSSSAVSWATQVLDQAAVKQLAALPSLDQLRGKIIGFIQAPATKIAGNRGLCAGRSELARVIGAYANKPTPPETCSRPIHP